MMSLQERLDGCKVPLLKKLFQIMIDKKTNLCVAADDMSIEATLRLIDKIGPHICILKLHSEHYGCVSEEFYQQLYDAKKHHNFLLFEDRKFSDGYRTVRASYEKVFAKYMDIVTVMPDFNSGIFKAIEEGAKNAKLPADEPRGCLAVCELSFADVIRPSSELLLEVAERNSPTCIGIVGQKLQVNDRFNMIKASPGVHVQSKGDGVNQQWRSPEQVLRDGADILIVGSGITSFPEDQWESLAMKYKNSMVDLKTMPK